MRRADCRGISTITLDVFQPFNRDKVSFGMRLEALLRNEALYSFEHNMSEHPSGLGSFCRAGYQCCVTHTIPLTHLEDEFWNPFILKISLANIECFRCVNHLCLSPADLKNDARRYHKKCLKALKGSFDSFCVLQH